MHILLETGSIQEIKEYFDNTLISGFFINPSLLNKNNVTNSDIIQTYFKLGGETSNKTLFIFIEGDTAEDMCKKATQYFMLAKKLLKNQFTYINGKINFCIPFTEEGVLASELMIKEGYYMNFYPISTISQFALAQTLKVQYFSVYMHELGENGYSSKQGADLIEQCKMINQKSFIATSIRSVQEAEFAIQAVPYFIALPQDILKIMFKNETSDIILNRVKKDFSELDSFKG